MSFPKALFHTALIAGVGLFPAACARQPDRSGMQGMSGMQGHSMEGMDMQTMMKQCADMRRQMAQGTHQNTPDMAQTMAHCDEMDRSMGSMGSMPGMGSTAAPAAAPAGTRSRYVKR